jgi:hypothetical protein
MAILNNSNAISPSGYNVNNSLRFRSSASAYLSRTPASTGDRQKWTFSAWVKRGASGVRQGIFVANPSGAVYWGLEFETGNNLNIYDSNAGGTTALTTTALYRDFGAWYHVVVAVDTTQATAANRCKIYVNGDQVTSFVTTNYPSQNSNTQVNTGSLAHYIGNWNPSVANLPLDGYMAEVNFIDGSQKVASDFGAIDATTGVWKPKAYSGTYGTNGFYLKFSDIATTSGSNAGLGKDFSGNTNYWTTNNISVTSGVTYDAMKDSPTNTSATVANYCVVSPIAYRTTTPTPTITNGNLTVVCPSASLSSIGSSTFGVSSGKWYWEVTKTGTAFGNTGVALAPFSQTVSSSFDFGSESNEYAYQNGGTKVNNNSATSYGASYTNGDVIGVALDLDAGTLTFYKNNTSQGTAFSSLPTGTYIVGCYDSYNGSGFEFNFGQRPFSYTPPTGYVALNTYNLPTPTILQGNKYMDATLFTGNGVGQSIVNNAQFKPDFVWWKDRTTAGIWHMLSDSVRGTGKTLSSNQGDAEYSGYTSLTAFNNNGFTLGLDTGTGYFGWNTNTKAYVGWQWQAGQGSTSSNTSGSITSTVSVNTTAGFSIATFTGASTQGATFGHGLGVAPKMIIAKSKTGTTQNWWVYHTSLGYTNNIVLNSTGAAFADSNTWLATPSSTLVTIGDNFSTVATYVAYCWAEIAGFSKFGSWTGNASTDGPFVFCNFRPRFILFKNSSAATVWIIFDTARNTYNFVDTQLRPNASDADNSAGSAYSIDVLSNGFKIRSSDSNFNGSGNTIIYAAFAEHPAKISNAR